jgi:hypothetical protein
MRWVFAKPRLQDGDVMTDPVALTPSKRDTRAEIELHLWAAIDLMAATLVKPDERIWDPLFVYRSRDMKDVTTFEGFILALHDMMDRGYSAEGALAQVVVRAHKQLLERAENGQHHSDR